MITCWDGDFFWLDVFIPYQIYDLVICITFFKVTLLNKYLVVKDLILVVSKAPPLFFQRWILSWWCGVHSLLYRLCDLEGRWKPLHGLLHGVAYLQPHRVLATASVASLNGEVGVDAPLALPVDQVITHE